VRTVGATTVGELANVTYVRPEEASIVADLKAGSEDAYSWLVTQFHQPVYSLVYRILDDPADAPDTTQEVFLKVFRGIGRFNGESSLKTWIYRIAVHEASNRRRWFLRHKQQETSMEAAREGREEHGCHALRLSETLATPGASPLDEVMRREASERVEQVLSELPEPYRTTVVLRDVEELSYEQIAEVMEISLGTVKSRLVRGREALRRLLQRHAAELGPEFEALVLEYRQARQPAPALQQGTQEIEVLP
jgi:RNA polymerase sigma-70 factor (ECF subfamily)